MPSRSTVGVVIPTLNEAANLPDVLAKLPAMVDEVVIVDGRSKDDTVKVALECRPDVRIVIQDGTGKGNALQCGFRACTSDIIVMLDADGSSDPEEIPQFVAALTEGPGADYAKGSRFLHATTSDDITPIRRMGNRILVSIVNRLWSTTYTDLCYGYNAFWSRTLPFIAPDCAGFEVETVMNIRAASGGLSVAEVQSHEKERLSGVSNLRVVRDGLRILRSIASEWKRRDGRTDFGAHTAVDRGALSVPSALRSK